MADDKRLNIRQALENSAQEQDVSRLQNAGVRKVKVLDERALLELIERAVDEVVHTQTADERSRILADSRAQLKKLMDERDQIQSQAHLAEAGRNELLQTIEKLQNEIRLRREVSDQESALAKKSAELAEENAWLRKTNDESVDKLDQAQQESARLKAENDELRAENERLRAEIERLKAELAGKESGTAELAAAQDEIAKLQEQLDAVRQGASTAANAVKHELDRSREKAAKLEQQLKEAKAAAQEAERLRAELAQTQARVAEAEDAAREAKARASEVEEEARDIRESAEAKVRESRKELEELRAKPPPPPPEPLPEPYVMLDSPTMHAAPAPEAAAEPEEAPAAEPPPAAAVVDRDTYIPAVEPLPPGAKAGKGLDVGTVNLVSACQGPEGSVEIRQQRNVFIDVEITPYTKAMLTRLNVPYVVQSKRLYVLGQPAFQLANVLNRRTRRPMKDGLISPQEQDALPIMKMLVGSILGNPRAESEVCFYSVPGDPVDQDLSVAYHRDLFDAVLKSLGYKPSHILEGHAVTFAELSENDFTGIGISCGGGMFNVCVAYKSVPALTFSTARSGDWVDRNAAQAVGLTPEKIAGIKEKGVDLLAPKGREEDAIAIYYRNLIQYNLMNIAERFRSSENMPTFNDPVPVVFSGGTALAGNFIGLAQQVFEKVEFPIPVKEIRLAKDALNATAKGALVAAQLEMAESAPKT